MSILSNIAEGWFSYKTSSGYQKLAPRTKSTLVSMEDGTSVENKVNSVAQGNNSVSFTQAGTRQNISASDTIKTILGKISKWFADLKTVAFSGSYNDLSNKPTIVNNGTTTTTNTVLDGRMGKTLADKDTNLQSQITSLNSALESYYGSNYTGSINSLKTPGIYWCDFTQVTGAIWDDGYGWVEVIKAFKTGEACIQKIYRYTDSGVAVIAYRCYTNNKWYPTRLLNTSPIS